MYAKKEEWLVIKAVWVDADRLALMEPERILGRFEDSQTIGLFANAAQAIDQLMILQPNVVFLDILMPVKDGLQTIKRIAKVWPTAEIVFLTAAGKYAQEAVDRTSGRNMLGAAFSHESVRYENGSEAWKNKNRGRYAIIK
jgi:DNA-binding NarL/FixJ family response regulator